MNSIYKNQIVHRLENNIIEKFQEEYLSNSNKTLEDIIYSEIENRFEILADYVDETDKDKIIELYFKEISKDLDEDDIIESVSPESNYHGLSDYERNS